ncbi:hypothetical protein RB195_014126 [Necator americanus]|uniref:CDP-diacylglycerol--glycerol-3-phosphate 3-phosphatidyltransferase n=1 Tax=Necator americanus TaxID=51031 RepID=A0ABR1DYW0_NECAM
MRWMGCTGEAGLKDTKIRRTQHQLVKNCQQNRIYKHTHVALLKKRVSFARNHQKLVRLYMHLAVAPRLESPGETVERLLTTVNMDWNLPECRAIPVAASSVRVLETPKEFYDFLVERSRYAKFRIVFSTLYFGDGLLEHKLIDSIGSNIEQNDKLRVDILLDYLRGTRGVGEEKSSTSLLRTIADKATVYLYHTPKLTGFVKNVLPERTNEIVGLQHMKVYIFDNSVLISGANLSDSYFVNRQDRYVLFENCKDLADFFHDIINAVGDCSFLLKGDGSIVLHPSCTVHPYEGSFIDYRNLLRSKVSSVIASLQAKQISSSQSSSDTLLYPLVQMGLFGYNEEYELLKQIFCSKANGFFGAAGPSGYIPALYSWVCERVLTLKDKYARNDVNLYEYHRDGWTFHAKGLWIDTPVQTATLMGSSNFGYRSVHRDLEAEILLVTSNDRLRAQLKDERKRLFDYSSFLDAAALRRVDHHIPVIVRIVSRMVRNFF